MQIVKAEIFVVDLPLINTFTTSFGSIKKRSTVIIKLISKEGLIGWGESAALSEPIYSSESVDTESLILKKYLIPSILNKDFKSVEDFIASYQFVKGHNFAKCGLECAFWCLISLKEKKTLTNLFGGNRTKIAVGESMGIKKTIEDTLTEIQIRLNEGYRRIKIKIKPGLDINLLSVIRKKFDNIPLMVDGNSAYTLNDIQIFKKLDKYNLLMIEQPLGETDIVDHACLQKEIVTSICLDESILSVEDARKAIRIGACKIINIKPGRVGGILESIKIHDLCQKYNIPVWCGGMLESGIGRSFNIALASLPNFIYPADMSPSNIFYKEDLINPTYLLEKGYIKVSQSPGLGYRVDEDKINHGY